MSAVVSLPCAASSGFGRRRARPLLGTLVEISGRGTSAQEVDAAIDQAFTAVQTIHGLMSYHDSSSDVSRLNRAGAACVAVHPHTWQVLATAHAVAQASDGQFDVSIAPKLVALGHLPRHRDLAQPTPGANWQDIEMLPGCRVRLARPLHIDLGGIAKGYAVDCAIRVLQDAGMCSGGVNAGGDLRLFGAAAELIHVRHPCAATQLLPLCQLSEGAIATSATYSSSSGARGRPATPLIDVANRPACNSVRSVSVLADRCIVADALTKVVYGNPAHALATLETFGAHAIVLEADLASPGGCRARVSGPAGWNDLTSCCPQALAA